MLFRSPKLGAPDALLEIVEFVEQKGLRADKSFLSAYPITLTSFRNFSREQLELERQKQSR